MTMPSKIARYLALADQVFQIANSNASDKTKYNLIFSDDSEPCTSADVSARAYHDPHSDADDVARRLSRHCAKNAMTCGTSR